MDAVGKKLALTLFCCYFSALQSIHRPYNRPQPSVRHRKHLLSPKQQEVVHALVTQSLATQGRRLPALAPQQTENKETHKVTPRSPTRRQLVVLPPLNLKPLVAQEELEQLRKQREEQKAAIIAATRKPAESKS